MNKIFSKKILGAAAGAVLLSSTIAAQTADDFGDFGSDFGGESNKEVTVSGRVSLDARAYCDTDDSDKIEMQAIPDARIGFTFSGNNSDVNAIIHLDEYTIKNYPEDVLEEFTLRGCFDNLQIEAGKMKIVWGKGDKNHVIDNFNADDYHDFIIPDYIDRRVATPMIRAKYNFNANNLSLEAVYTPFLPVDRFASDRQWVPGQVTQLKKTVTELATQEVSNAFSDYTKRVAFPDKYLFAYKDGVAQAMCGTDFANAPAAYQPAISEAANSKMQEDLQASSLAYMTTLTQANALSSNTNLIYPDMKTLKYGQYGARLTGTFGPVDLGLSYYNGYYKQPSVNGQKMQSYITNYLSNSASENDKFLEYDKKQTFGFEFATAIWHFNIRGEACYNLTDDTDGTNPWVHNNSIGWLGGFDIDLPFWNMNVNIQETGNYILNNDKIKSNVIDMEKNYNDKYTENKLIANISASFINDKLVPELTFIWVIENNDFIILPKLTYTMSDGLSLNASGLIISSTEEESQFYSWRNNSYISLGASYKF